MGREIVELLVVAVALVTAMLNLASSIARIQELERSKRERLARGGRHRRR